MTPPATARVRPAPAGPAPALRTLPKSMPRPQRAPAFAPRMPRRVSGPARLRRAAAPALALSELPLLDRLIKGRAWIGLVAFALIGIVTMQLALLKLNAGIGRALVHEAGLERENSALSVEASEAQAADTVELQAGRLGMQLVAPGTLQFLSAHGGESVLARAVAALNTDAARAAGTGMAGVEGAAGTTGETSAAAADETGAAAGAAGGASEASEAGEPAAAASEASAGASEASPPAGQSTEASATAVGETSGSSSSGAAAAGETSESSPSSAAAVGETSGSSSSGDAPGPSASPQG
jgi:hypothetical protein